MDAKLRGTVCGIAAAVFYGTNPLGAMNLYADGISTNSTLFYRFGIAVIILGVMMAVQRKSFALTRRELATLAILGVFMSTSSTTLYFSFNFMDVGIASTLLFVYPVMVAVIMATFFHEKVTAATVIAIYCKQAEEQYIERELDRRHSQRRLVYHHYIYGIRQRRKHYKHYAPQAERRAVARLIEQGYASKR